jgi:hypothetical protein
MVEARRVESNTNALGGMRKHWKKKGVMRRVQGCWRHVLDSVCGKEHTSFLAEAQKSNKESQGGAATVSLRKMCRCDGDTLDVVWNKPEPPSCHSRCTARRRGILPSSMKSPGEIYTQSCSKARRSYHITMLTSHRRQRGNPNRVKPR